MLVSCRTNPCEFECSERSNLHSFAEVVMQIAQAFQEVNRRGKICGYFLNNLTRGLFSGSYKEALPAGDDQQEFGGLC